jgi:hypothetical protein
MMSARLSALAVAGLLAVGLTACVPFPQTAPQTESGTSVSPSTPPSAAVEPQPVSTDAAIDAVSATVMARYEAVKSGDYAAACALYSDLFIEKFSELAETEGQSCEAAHAAGQQNSDDYQATAKEQGRAGLTPFFYVPSEIAIDPTLISIEDNGTTAFLKPLSVTSLDPTEFEDGVGEVPGWIEGQDYLKLIDGRWVFIFMTEQ